MDKKIKSTTQYKHDYIIEDVNAQQIELKGAKYSYTEFDNKGNVLLEIRFNKSGDIEEKYENKYNESGHLIEELVYLSENEIAEHKSYEYNEKGIISKSHKHYQDDTKDTINYEYEDGKLIKKQTIDFDEEEEAREEFEYVDAKLVSRKVFEYDDLVFEESYVYDDAGNIVEQSKWTNDEDNSKYYNQFNEKGNLEKTLTYNIKDQLLAKSEYFYNERGLLEKIEEDTLHGKNITTLEYDDNNNIIKQTEKNEAGDINNKAERKYNENGDVIESEVFIDFHGMGINQHYILTYDYVYFE